ncbi:hypothetical protein Sros01_03530 [Streptomyces roseochromogenus]|nr:hypothetical protein Sros01_03530 [Streptomyces roseochromogenus]
MSATESETGGIDGLITVPVGGFFFRLLNRIVPARWTAEVMRVLVVPLDAALQVRSRGRFSAGRILGVPSLLLTTVGARSGRPVATPLFYVPHAAGYAVVASNFGRAHHPAWSDNLLQNPAASLCTGGRRMPVSARPVMGAEREEIWQGFLRISADYRVYRDNSGRELRIFHLQPTGSGKAGLPVKA